MLRSQSIKKAKDCDDENDDDDGNGNDVNVNRIEPNVEIEPNKSS